MSVAEDLKTKTAAALIADLRTTAKEAGDLDLPYVGYVLDELERRFGLGQEIAERLKTYKCMLGVEVTCEASWKDANELDRAINDAIAYLEGSSSE